MGSLSLPEVRFAANMAAIRRARHISQADLGASIGLARTTIVAIEAGDRRIRLDEACAISDVLGVPMNDLTSDRSLAGQDHQTSDDQKLNLAEERSRYIDLLMDLVKGAEGGGAPDAALLDRIEKALGYEPGARDSPLQKGDGSGEARGRFGRRANAIGVVGQAVVDRLEEANAAGRLMATTAHVTG